MAPRHSSTLARYLAGAYLLLVVYASLHPLSGWHDNGAPLLDFLHAAWPRYYTGFDLIINMLAYVPLGFLLAPALRGRRVGLIAAAILAVLISAALSFCMEMLQHYLPTRVPSNVDLAGNSLGALIGAVLGMNWGRELVDGGRLHAWRVRRVAHGKAADFALVLMGLWLFTQLNPEILLFGSGDLRALLELQPLPYTVNNFIVVEAGVAAAGALAAGLIFWLLLRAPRRWMLVVWFMLALFIRAFANALLVSDAQFAQWVTPGNMTGLALGASLLMLATWLPALMQQVLAALALLFAMALVNLAPENPYLANTLQVWSQGHFLNFNGLTRLVSVLWPYAALTYLMLSRGRHAVTPA